MLLLTSFSVMGQVVDFREFTDFAVVQKCCTIKRISSFLLTLEQFLTEITLLVLDYVCQHYINRP